SDGNSFLWESFDDMSDTLLPGMKLGWDLQINLNRFMRSWKSSDDPSDGDFSFSLDPPESPQLVLRRGSQKQYRWGPFDGKGFSGSNELRANPVFQPLFVYNADEVYYEFQQQDESVLLRFQVTPLGLVQYFTWRLGSSTEWSMMVTLNRDYCDSYGMCGPYGNCYSDDPNCRCIDGFTPTSPQDWKLVDWKDGCTRKYELNCSNRDGFVRYTGLKLPDNSTVWPNFSQSPETCRAECLRTCGCMAYANIDVHGNGSRCVVWLGQLIDMRSFPNGGEELYIRMAHAELGTTAGDLNALQQPCGTKKAEEQFKDNNPGDRLDCQKHIRRHNPELHTSGKSSGGGFRFGFVPNACHLSRKAIASAKRKKLAVKISVIVILTAIGMLLFSVVGWYIHHIRAKRKALAYIPYDNPEEESHPDDNLKLPLFHLDTIVVATDNFSYEKKIGQGGFGAVYKNPSPVDNLHNELSLVTLQYQGLGIGSDEIAYTMSIWTVPRPSGTVHNPVLQLLDSGNLVVRDGNNNSDKCYLWESFDYPCDTLLPGMKLGWDYKSSLKRVMTSWKTNDDPVNGDFSLSLELLNQSPELVLLGKNSAVQSRWGPWDGQQFSGSHDFESNPVFRTMFVSNADEFYIGFEGLDKSILYRFVVSPWGNIEFLKWKNHTNEWIQILTLNKDSCDRYGSCGPYGICYNDDPSCRCLQGFAPSSPQDWARLDCTGGCNRKHKLNCSDADGFVKYEGLKLPDNSTVWKDLSPAECVEKCLMECACMAYTNLDVYGNGSQCVVWLADLVDIRILGDGGHELYIRMGRNELESITSSKREKEVMLIVVSLLSTICATLVLALAIRYITLVMQANRRATIQGNIPYQESTGNQHEDMEIQLYNMDTISTATNNFASFNKVGQGGFGSVYKAWKLWNEGNPLELMDPVLELTYNEDVMIQCIQVGLLCVQQRADDRPTMASVVSMLRSESASLPEPQQPGFFNGRSTMWMGSSSCGQTPETSNGVTVSTMSGR
ncbi:hypothetical protein RJ639_042723, partial [Escallonia herrerae]